MTRPAATPSIKPAEAQFMGAVIDLARRLGWLCAHFRPAMTAHGWCTPVQADGKGWPDLALAHPTQHRLILAELKAGDRKPTPDQDKWLDILRGIPGIEVYLWQADTDFDNIVEILQRKGD